jgi:hypothetical protein
MSWLGDRLKDAWDKVGTVIVGNVKTAISAGVLTLLGAGWLYIWSHFNPLFSYTVQPSSVASHFIALGQILNKIDRDSGVYCSGGWDERFARVGLRKCYHFSFNPTAVYRMYVCTHDQRTTEVTTSDQLVALRTFETRFAPLACFRVSPQAQGSYKIDPGNDTHFRAIQFSSEPAEVMAFCGCSNDEVNDIVRIIGAAPP